jgi:hypothetical protein
MTFSDIKINGDLISDALENKAIQKEIENLVKSEFESQKAQMIQGFFQDEISREIKDPELGNISKTLGGYGDLFGFIGFFAGSDPVQEASEVIFGKTELKSIQIERIYNRDARGRFTSGRRYRNVKISFTSPTLDDFDDTSQRVVRDYSGRNWIKGVEKGISGFNRYANYPRGESGRGVELRGAIKNPSVARPEISNYKPRGYVTPLIQEFVKKISGL